jgi:hypothetical protein
MIEQGIMTWLPTFNDKVLHLPENIRIMIEAAHEKQSYQSTTLLSRYITG